MFIDSPEPNSASDCKAIANGIFGTNVSYYGLLFHVRPHCPVAIPSYLRNSTSETGNVLFFFCFAQINDELFKGFREGNTQGNVNEVLAGVLGHSRLAVRFYLKDDLYLDPAEDAAVQPTLVIVYLGGNDSMGPYSSGLGPHIPLPEYIESMKKITTHLKGLLENIRIIFLSCPPVDKVRVCENASSYFSELVQTNELCRQYSEACIELCKEMNLKFVDLWTTLQNRED